MKKKIDALKVDYVPGVPNDPDEVSFLLLIPRVSNWLLCSLTLHTSTLKMEAVYFYETSISIQDSFLLFIPWVSKWVPSLQPNFTHLNSEEGSSIFLRNIDIHKTTQYGESFGSVCTGCPLNVARVFVFVKRVKLQLKTTHFFLSPFHSFSIDTFTFPCWAICIIIKTAPVSPSHFR